MAKRQIPNPDDRTLLECVVAFAEWKPSELSRDIRDVVFPEEPPDYLNSVDAWLSDVYPKLRAREEMRITWWSWFCDLSGWQTANLMDMANAPARIRCHALWLALQDTDERMVVCGWPSDQPQPEL